jgi:ribonuclease HII
MEALHRLYPQYNFARHKGYATPEHLEALRCWGPCDLHRRTFKGVKEWVAGMATKGKM